MLEHAIEDKCPMCASTDLDFGVAEVTFPDGVQQTCTCNNCGATFDQWYSLEFDGHYNIYGANGEEIPCLLKGVDNGN